MPTNTFSEEAEMIRQGFEYELCEECGGDLGDHRIGPDALGHAHAYCLRSEHFLTEAEAREMGRAAFESGAPRIVPRYIIVGNNETGNGIPAAKAWYAGWDRANLDAPWDED